jgi:tetratricopeptide (TPR) repeat protein
MSSYAMAPLDEIDEIPYRDCRLRPVRHHFGITALGVNAWAGREAGDRMIPEHKHDDDHQELYLVVRGHAVFEVDGERLDAPAGTLVFPRPGAVRTAFAEEADTSILALGARPGRAYEPSDWEILNPLSDAGEYAEAADRARELIQVHPESAMLVYNLACYESLAGRTDDAIGHLRLAIDRKESFRSFAAEDSDFDPIRAEAAFKELVQDNAGERTSG